MNLFCLKLLKFFHLLNTRTYKKLRNIEVIQNSPLFNSIWYQKEYRLSNTSNLAKHYLETGAQKGFNPSTQFDTNKYLELCPDVAASGINPLVHYELYGKKENRIPELTMKDIFKSYGQGYHTLRKLGRKIYKKKIQRNQKVKILVHLHLYYVYAWTEIKEFLDNLSCYTYDLIVTYPEVSFNEEIINSIKKYKKNVQIICVENRGFDIGPFIGILKNVNLNKYDIVYHLHTKSIAGKGRLTYGRLFKGKSWFHQCFSGTLGVFNVHKGIDILLNSSQYGIIAAKNLMFTDTPERRNLVCEYAKRLGINVPENYVFIGGSCFGIKANALKNIQKLNFSIDSFQPSRRYIFTLAHAMERIIFIIALNNGIKIKGLHTLYNNHPLRVWQINQKLKKYQNKLLKKLHQFGFSDLKPLKLDTRSGLGCSFFSGIYKDKKVFIKYGGDVSVAQNEYYQQQLFKKILGNRVPEVIMYDSSPFVVMEYLPGYNLEELVNFGLSKNEKKKIIEQLQEIKQKLEHSFLLHRDIRPTNLIYADGILRLIDFQFAVEKAQNGEYQELPYLEENLQKLSVLGEDFRASDGQFDDIESIQKVIDYIQQQKEQQVLCKN